MNEQMTDMIADVLLEMVRDYRTFEEFLLEATKFMRLCDGKMRLKDCRMIAEGVWNDYQTYGV